VCASPRLETGWLGVSAVLFGQTLAVIQDVEIPLGLTADASLNQVVIGDFGCPEVAGMRAGQACSRDALLALATECGLAGLRPDRLSDGIGAAVASASPGEAQAAAAALVSYGGRLGALIATLRHPRTPGEQGRTPIRRAFLAYWLSVDSIWLGGGLLAGRCGAVIVAAAQAAAAASAWPCRVALTPYPEIAPLLGAALHGDVTGAAEVIVVADLGHTSIKTAIAERHATAVTGLTLLGACAAPPSGGPVGEAEDAVAGSVNSATITAGTWLGSGFRPAHAPLRLHLAAGLWTGGHT
jgi:hypothetical protein